MRRVLFAGITALALGAFCLWADASRDRRREVLYRKGSLREVRVEATEGPRRWLTLVSGSGLSVECGVLEPPSPGRKPAILLLPGNAAGRRAIERAGDESDVVLLAPNYPYVPPDDPGVLGVLSELPRARRAVADVVPSALLALDYLASRVDVDPKRIAVVGYSFGALFVPAVTATDRRVAAAVLVDGGAGLSPLIATGLRRAGWPHVAPVAGLAGSLFFAPWEPLRYVPGVAPTPLVMINSRDDEAVPEGSVLALFRGAREPKSLVWLAGGHVRSGDPALLARVEACVRESLLRLGILPAPPGEWPRRAFCDSITAEVVR